jgi:carbamoyl-phosphate synthase small subunit
MPKAGSKPRPTRAKAPPESVNAAIVLADGMTFWGQGIGATGVAVGEVCFNTSITGYQEILTDPSYAGQIITFTFPHIGNVGTNAEDIETATPAARGLILRAAITEPSRALTRRIRDLGAPNGALCHVAGGAGNRDTLDIARLKAEAARWPGLEGMDLAKEVSCRQAYHWDQTRWSLGGGYGVLTNPRHHVVAVDYGAKHNILRCLAALGCAVTVVPATASAGDILGHKPDGVFLSNGPGDPAATGAYAVPVIMDLLSAGIPIFGICLGHQILAIALGASTRKMEIGHRGANHPVKDLATGKVEITSQNHGFVVIAESLPDGVVETHKSLFDGSLEGLKVTGKPVFSVQYHPEASPGPEDSHYLFERFVELMEPTTKKRATA